MHVHLVVNAFFLFNNSLNPLFSPVINTSLFQYSILKLTCSFHLVKHELLLVFLQELGGS